MDFGHPCPNPEKPDSCPASGGGLRIAIAALKLDSFVQVRIATRS